MIYRLAEVAPAAPLIVEALPPLLILAGLLFALGCVMLIDGFVRSLFGAVASIFTHIPIVGGLTSDAIHRAEHAISNALGTAISGIEKNIAHQWHNLARVLTHFWHVLEHSAENIYQLSKIVAGFASLPDLNALQRRLRHLIAVAEHDAARGIAHALRNAKVFTRSVAQGVYPRLRAVEHDVAKTIPREIKSARALAREAEDGVARLWKAVRALPGTREIEAAVAVAIAALGLEGLNLLKCREAGNLYNKRGCGLWNDLDGLLALFAAVAVVEDYRDLVKLAQSVEHEVTVGVQDVLKV